MPRHRRTNPFALLTLLFVAGCGPSAEGPAEQPVPAVGVPEADIPSVGETYRVRFETTKGDFVVEVHPEWAPRGAQRFREIVEQGLYDGNRFFRAVPNFVVQWGIHGDPAVSRAWREKTIPDEPVVQGNARGRITFAMGGPNSRTTQVFVSLKDNTFLDDMGFPAFGEVVQGMDVVDALHTGYGEQPKQDVIQNIGEPYFAESFPKLDKIERAVIVEEDE